MKTKRTKLTSPWKHWMGLICFIPFLAGCHTDKGTRQEESRIEDIDGNTYKTVQIAQMRWMAEDLKTTRFNDGKPIPRVENYDQWAELSTPAYSWYNNDSLQAESYGALYNWYVVESGKLCPEGWHVPSDEEWIALETALGGAAQAGAKLKEEGTAHWKTPNTEAVNSHGFRALPGGYRSYNGTFNLMRTSAYWWSSSQKSWYGSASRAVYRYVLYNDRALSRHIAEQNNGFSVRCLEDQSPAATSRTE